MFDVAFSFVSNFVRASTRKGSDEITIQPIEASLTSTDPNSALVSGLMSEDSYIRVSSLVTSLSSALTKEIFPSIMLSMN